MFEIPKVDESRLELVVDGNYFGFIDIALRTSVREFLHVQIV